MRRGPGESQIDAQPACGRAAAHAPAGLRRRIGIVGVRGRDETLSYGYQAFWHPQGAPAAHRIRAAPHDDVPHAHNGLIDVALDVGIVGLLDALAVLAGLFRRAVADARAGRHDQAVLRLLAVAFAVLPIIVASNLLDENAFATIVIQSQQSQPS